MKDNAVIKKICSEVKSFLTVASDIKEEAYLFLFTLYILVYFIINIEWSESIRPFISNFRYALLGIVMWGTTLYLIYFLAVWKKLWNRIPCLIIVALPLLAATVYFSQKMSTNSYGVVMDIFFCVMACGKRFRKILQCTLCVAIVMLFIAGIGVPLGFTLDLIKPDNIHPGHSLGIIYPNTWGDLVYLALIILWYLYLRNKPLITFAIFWPAGAFMYIYIYSRTMAIFSMIFPVAAVIIDAFERKYKQKAGVFLIDRSDGNVGAVNNGKNEKYTQEKIGLRQDKLSQEQDECKISEIIEERTDVKTHICPLGWIVVAIPFLSLIFVIFVSMQMEWIHNTFYYTWFHNFAMRFVQGGFYLKKYGMPLLGNPYRGDTQTYMYINGEYLALGNLDSAFVSYIIMRGMVWIVYTLLWLCIANWKALKVKDYAIPFLSTAILLFAMMERIGLEMWYNFILLYPLARVSDVADINEDWSMKILKYLPLKFTKKG